MKIYKSSEIKDIDKKIESESNSPLILDESKKSNSNSKKKKKKSTSQKKKLNSSSKKNKNKYKIKPLNLNKLRDSTKNSALSREEEEDDVEKDFNEINKIEFIYSPRTSFIKEQLEEDKLYNDLGVSFDPVAIKIIKSFFKERLGELSELEFIKVVKNNLHSWHPELPDRIKFLSKLLIKLCDDIDLNNNKTLEWDEFTNYIMNSGENVFQNRLNYQLKFYAPAKNSIDHSEFSDLITHAFYIEKYNLIGIVIEGKSQITFYDGETCKKTKTYIDIKETQSKIDILEINLLEKKAEEVLLKKEEEKKLKFQLHNENLMKKRKNNLYNLINNTLFTKKKIENDNENDSNKSEINNNISLENRIDKPKNAYLKTSSNVETKKYTKVKDFHKKLTILCTCFVDEYNLLFVSSSNNIISAWKYIEQDFKNINHIIETDNTINMKYSEINTCPLFSADQPQNTMDWDPMQKKLYSGQGDGKILVWDILKSKGKEEACLDFKKAKSKHDKENLFRSNDELNLERHNYNIKNKNVKKKNEIPKDQQLLKNSLMEKILSNIKTEMSRDGVSSIKVLGKMQMIAAGYYNGSVIIWDLMLRDYRKFYNDQNTGIYQIAYDENKKLIFTCGFDHDIYIYDPYIDGYSINKLTGHNWSINSIACDEAMNEFVSIDIYGNIKIWDLDTFYNYQTININETVNIQTNSNNKKLSSNQKMILLTKVNKIFTYGEKIMIFNKETASLPDLCDNQPILGCFYREHKFQFITVSLKKIKVWNIFNGKIIRIYDEILSSSTAEITCFVCDLFTKKLYIGESTGVISCIDINVGKVIVNYEKHDSEIISLKYSEEHFILISLSYDGTIKIHKEIELTKIYVLKTFILDFFKISQISYNEAYSRLIIGSDQGDLRFFDIQYLRQDSYNELIFKGKALPKKNDQLSNIFAFRNLPLILTCHDSGINRFIIIPPNNFNYNVISEFKNYDEKKGKKYSIKILSCCFDYESKKLYTADFFGKVNSYSLIKLFNIIKDSNEITLEMMKEIDKINNEIIDLLFTFEAHKGCIKEIIFPQLKPKILITTGNDLHVKLFSAENGEFIDELKQSSEKNKEYPLGIKYYLTDPFVSKINKGTHLVENVIYRKDIKNFKYNKVRNILNNMRKNKSLITDYCNKITEINAKEKLFLLNQNAPVQEDKSTVWRLDLNVEEIKEKEKEKYDIKLKELLKKDDNFLYDNKYELITSNQYYPLFIRQMDEEELNNYTEALNSKMRKIDLTTSKILLKNNDYIEFEKERKKEARKINYITELKLLGKNTSSKKEFKSEKFDLLNKERLYRYGINKTKFKNSEDKFNNYKEDFQRNLINLEKSIEDKLIPLKYLNAPTNYNTYSKLVKKNKSPINKNISLNLNDGKLPLIRNKTLNK
jgi:hypothetical protein